MESRKRRPVWWFAAPLLLIPIALLFIWRTRTSEVADPVSTQAIPAAAAPSRGSSAAAPHAVRILAGSFAQKSVDRFGVEWMGDRYFVGGDQNRWEFGGKGMGVNTS